MSFWDLANTLVGVGGSIFGAVQGANAARDASKTQAASSDRAADVAKEIYFTNRADFAPFREAGVNALTAMGNEIGSDPAQDPEYQFQLTEGLKGIDRSMAARGLLGSGAGVKAATRYAQGAASDAYGRRWNRLASMAGLGQTATGQTAQAGQTFAGQAGQAIQNAGTARASGYVGQANAINSGINNLMTLGYLYRPQGA